ncbi:hypothetical protein TEA_015017 [Camellia sinensis var. sinensis]|uniref:Uncharacterized protein n=1 Tax=Camellia sinensis var. sinensis TaxID=542762 RepID=A0A4S4EYL8_CAMSN|nr:hypothetical protein TEA_015017 [Camellia sinensis var. sinensis]
MQSREGSAILRLPEEQAAMMGLRMNSESERESSRAEEASWRTPGREEEESGEVGVELEGELSLSRTDLHWWTSLECLSQEPFLMILSRAGMRTWFRPESASGEAISGGGVRWGSDLGVKSGDYSEEVKRTRPG